MIKKLLLIILVCILGVGIFNSWSYGFSFNMFGIRKNISSYNGIVEKSQNLTSGIDNLERKNGQEFTNALNKKKAAANNFETNKQEYDDLASKASEEEIREANKENEYFLDYLWMKVGTYANNSDIKVLINPDYQKNTISFDVSGRYIAVINFIYDLENDKDLAFNIDNLVMQGGSSESVTKASFMVRNIKIITSQVQDEEIQNSKIEKAE